MENILKFRDLSHSTKFLQNLIVTLFYILQYKQLMLKHLFIAFILSLNVAIAQSSKSGQVFGKIVDASNNEALPFATIGFFQTNNTKDSLVGGMTVPITGEFLFTNLPLGKLTVKISFVGYQSVSQVIEVGEEALDLKSIRLTPDSKLLQEVQVKGEKDQVSLEIGRAHV